MRWNNTISVDIDVDDVIREIDTEDLINEIKSRKVTIKDFVDDPESLRSLLTYWFTAKKLPPLWVHSDQEIANIIITELNSK